MTGINLRLLMDGVLSHAAASGHFDAVIGHEPKNRPGNGISCAAWVQEVRPMAKASGLAATSAVVILTVRLYTSMISDPADEIDPNLMDAMDVLVTAYSSDFTLNDRCTVDLLGMTGGTGVSARAGYLAVGRGGESVTMHRVYDITLPLILFDVWGQSA